MNNPAPVIIEVTRRADQKLYPARPLARWERNRARWAAHHAVCRDGLSIRAAQAAMLAQGIRRSLGIIARDLRDFECDDCPRRLARLAERQQPASPADRQPGWPGAGWAGPAPA